MGIAVDVDDGSSTASDGTASTSTTPLLLPATDYAGCDGGVVVFSLFADGGDIDNLLIFLCNV